MVKTTKDEQKKLEQNLKRADIDLDKMTKLFENYKGVKYIPKKGYSDTNYKIYRFVDVNQIDIYLTPTTRLEEISKKYKLSKPIQCYIQPENEENVEDCLEFIKLTNELDINRIKEIEEEQKKFNKQIPYEIKYRDNFLWDIYYSEEQDKYFMLFPTKETQVETLFYLIKEKIKAQNAKRKKKIYIPINQENYSYNILKKSEISDIENYLWFFTNSWPTTYELQDKDNNIEIHIIGKTPVYEKIESNYKFVFTSKEEAQKQYKLLKAMFILQSNIGKEYEFKAIVNDEGSLDFCLNRNSITYEKLPEFINAEIEKNKEKIKQVQGQTLLEEERLQLLEQTVQKQKEEYSNKEKQIVMFLECKKSFFGRVSYYFKSKKIKKNKIIINQEQKKQNKVKKIEKIEIEEKSAYTIEDLLKVCGILEEKEKEYKNKQMDIKALENQKENLEKRINNATLYINEIEEHKKSIFEFWKYTNKDDIDLLQEGEENKEKESSGGKIRKVFSFEEDIEEFGKNIDEKQRSILLPKETDSIFAIKQDLETFNIMRKNKILKKDEKQIEKRLKQLKEQYEIDIEKVKEKDFDIFGNVVEDKTKIKTLNNKKHREIEKDKYKILDIHSDTTIEDYEDIIKKYLILLEDAYKKTLSPLDIPVYKMSNKPIEEDKFEIFNINEKNILEKIKDDEVILNKINIKKNMPVIFFTNIMYYDNLNKTLPLGMNISSDVLMDLSQFEIKLVSRKDFKINCIEEDLSNKIKNIQLYEYDIEKKTK